MRVQSMTVRTSAGQPASERAFAVADDPHGGRNIKPFGQGCQHFADPLRCRSELVERRIAARAEGGPTRLAAEGLDALERAMRAIADPRVDLGIGDAIVGAGAYRAREARGGDAFGRAPAAFQFAPRAYGRKWV